MVHRIVRDGFIAPVPKGWDVRVRALPLIKGTALTAATFRLPREPPLDGGLHQITTMRARDLYVTITGSPATADLSRGLKRVVNHQVPPVRLSEFKTNFEGASPARPRAWYSFIVGGTNYFCSITVVGPHPSSGQVARVNEFLRGIRIR